MAERVTRSRIVYAVEALALALVAPLGVMASPLILVFSLPALVLAVIGVIRPAYFGPRAFTDPRRGPRIYIHACAGISAALISWIVVRLAFM
jgi:hypothetical protein